MFIVPARPSGPAPARRIRRSWYTASTANKDAALDRATSQPINPGSPPSAPAIPRARPPAVVIYSGGFYHTFTPTNKPTASPPSRPRDPHPDTIPTTQGSTALPRPIDAPHFD